MTSTLLSPPTLPRQSQADITPATATLRQPQLSAPPSTTKTQTAHYDTTVPILHAATKANAVMITQPWVPVRNPKMRAYTAAKSP